MFAYIGYPEMLLIGFIAVLLFGKRLPEVAKSLGQGVVEFKKGIRGMEEEIDAAERNELPRSRETRTPSVPKFELPNDDDHTSQDSTPRADQSAQDSADEPGTEPPAEEQQP